MDKQLTSEQQYSVVAKIKQLVAVLPPYLQKKYTPRHYHKDAHIGRHVHSILELNPRSTFSMRELQDAISTQKGYEISSGAILYHLNKGCASGIYYKTTDKINVWGLSATMVAALNRFETPVIYRRFTSKAAGDFWQRIDQFGQVTWVTSNLDGTYTIVPRSIHIVINK